MKYFVAVLIFTAFGLMSCQNADTKGKDPAVKAVKAPNDDYSEIIRIEESIFGDEKDTALMAKMTFEEPIFNFGTVEEGDIVKHTFVYKNTGQRPLMLKVAHSTCGCTVPHYNTNTPLEPGDIDSIVVTFNTTHKTEKQNKPITVIANSYPNKVKLYLQGYVKPDPKLAPKKQIESRKKEEESSKTPTK